MSTVERFRLEQDMRQVDLGAALGISEAQISKIENGHRNVTVQTLHALARALHKEEADFFDRREPGPTRRAPRAVKR